MNQHGIYFDNDVNRHLFKDNFQNFGSGDQPHTIITGYNYNV